jgi:hypothetical protein
MQAENPGFLFSKHKHKCDVSACLCWSFIFSTLVYLIFIPRRAMTGIPINAWGNIWEPVSIRCTRKWWCILHISLLILGFLAITILQGPKAILPLCQHLFLHRAYIHTDFKAEKDILLCMHAVVSTSLMKTKDYKIMLREYWKPGTRTNSHV